MTVAEYAVCAHSLNFNIKEDGRNGQTLYTGTKRSIPKYLEERNILQIILTNPMGNGKDTEDIIIERVSIEECLARQVQELFSQESMLESFIVSNGLTKDFAKFRNKKYGNPYKNLTVEDIALLYEWGYRTYDMAQIDEAFEKTEFTLCNSSDKKKKEKRITKETAKRLLGKEQFLSGISRSAFHHSAYREFDEDRGVYFDSSDLFTD